MTFPSNKPTIVIDSREQRPFEFTNRVDTVVKKLSAGDYSLQNYETIIAIERKSLQDFIQTIIYAQDRFARELSILRSYPRAWIVVEGSIDDILQRRYDNDIAPEKLLAMAASLQATYNIMIQWCGDRPCTRFWVEEILVQFWNAQQK